jgi:hypothetical protein
VAEPDPAAPGELGEQDVRDQVAGEREEDADAEQPARGPAEADVVQDDGGDRERAQTVEAGPIALRLGNRDGNREPLSVVTAGSTRGAPLHGIGTQ